jgi:hypothetical protein
LCGYLFNPDNYSKKINFKTEKIKNTENTKGIEGIEGIEGIV